MLIDHRAQTFLTVISAGSFTAAAKQTFRSSVAIRDQVNSFEEEIGIPLLTRTNQGICPTEAGRLLYTGIKRLKDEATGVIDQVQSIPATKANTITLGTSLMRPSEPFLHRWMTSLSSAPSFVFRLLPFDDHFTGPNEPLLPAGVDCAFTPNSVLAWQNEYNFLRLGTSPAMLGVATSNPLSKREMLSWDDLNDQQLYLLKEGISPVVDEIRRQVKEKSPAVALHDLPVLYNLKSLDEVVAAGGLIELPKLWDCRHPGLKSVKMDWDFQIPYGLIYRKKPRQAVLDFVAALSQTWPGAA